jgi:2-oxoacid:acceptor oxidoreductase delta subunit (pyruvate/2-ketoisovalerate family)
MHGPFAITLDAGTSLANHTGAWRTMRPAYINRLPPCNQACPAGENIQAWLFHAESGDYEAAWRTLTQDNPMPAIMGRVCYQPCEAACNRARIDEAVGVNSVERFLGDEAMRHGWKFTPPVAETGKRILIAGSGPAGLSAAYHLRRAGHTVVIHEAASEPGGMMRYGIPRYRLPREVLDAEVIRILEQGITLKVNTKVMNLAATMAEGRFDAAFLAVGAHIAKRTYIPAGDAAKVLDAVQVLHSMGDGTQPLLGRRVVVYGGGNTAIDVARTARRLGASDSIIVYRRTRDRMPAHDFEVEDALKEGVTMQWLSTIKRMDEGTITVEKMALDASGFPQPTGEFETLEADSLVLALGQDVELSLLNGLAGLRTRDGVVETGANMMTGHPGIFAGGDMVTPERTVTVAVGHGKKAARHMDAWLRGTVYEPAPKHEVAAFEKLNQWYYADAPKMLRPVLEMVRRRTTFEEVTQGLNESNAQYEARRCLSCGNCFECDNCYGVCPDNAVIKLGPGQGFRFNYEYCKGCGICAQECPCGAIAMVAEEI